MSRHFQKAGDKPLEIGQHAGSKAPGKIGELLSKPFQLTDLIRHGVKLCPNQRTKPRTKSQLRLTIECAHQCLEFLKRQP